jgi:hypothetical protein
MLKRVGIALGLVLLGSALTLVIWVATHLDDPPVDDRDLRPVYADLPEHENGFVLLQSISERIEWPEQGDAAAEARALISGDAWKEALALRLLAANDFVEAELRAALGRRAQLPIEAPYSTELPAAWRLCRPAKVIALHAVDAARRDATDSAFVDIGLMLRLARAIEGAERAQSFPLIVAGCVRSMARKALGAVLSATPLTAGEAKRWSRALDALAPGPAAWRAAFAEDYAHMSAVVRTPPPKDWEVRESAWWAPDRYVFKPNASNALRAEDTRKLQRWTEHPCRTAQLGLLTHPLTDGEKLRMVASPNGWGLLLQQIVRPLMLETADHRCRIESDHEALVALIGLRAYQVENGSLPASLDALVPTFLSRAPRDGFDGKPLRYDAKRRLLWTIGGGDPAANREQREARHQFVFPIPF